LALLLLAGRALAVDAAGFRVFAVAAALDFLAVFAAAGLLVFAFDAVPLVLAGLVFFAAFALAGVTAFALAGLLAFVRVPAFDLPVAFARVFEEATARDFGFAFGLLVRFVFFDLIRRARPTAI
jgi:hypothetical protein